jgi:hypothetical protein
MFNCKFCNKETNTSNSNVQHELYCKSNPNRKIKKASMGMLGKKGANQYTYGAKMDEETRTKIRESTVRLNIKRWSDPQNRIKHSEVMKRVVANNPEAYTSSNRGRTKQIIYKGIKFQGSWELIFYKWCEDNNVACERNVEGFAYEWNGTRTYFPDFYLPSYDSYVEVKGYKTDQDDAKWKQFPKKLLVVVKKDIDNIKKDCYNITC